MRACRRSRSWAWSTSRPTRSRTAARSTTTRRRSRHARRLVAEGAAIVDVGGESTRPGRRRRCRAEEELRRVVPVVEGLAGARHCRARLDRHDEARRSRAPRSTRARPTSTTSPPSATSRSSAAFVADRGLDCCLMHMLGEPRTMQHDPRYVDVVSDVKAFLEERHGGRGGGRRARGARSSSTPGSASARRSSTTSSCCAGCDELADARPPARARHLAQVVPRPHHGPRRRPSACTATVATCVIALRARGARVPRPRRRGGARRAGGGGCYVRRAWP